MIALILSHFPLHSCSFLLFSLLAFSPFSQSFFVSVLSCVTFLLIYPLSSNKNHPRYSLISGQSHQPLFSGLGLIAGMKMTHHRGSSGPECHQWRWSLFCRPRLRLQIWPEGKHTDRSSSTMHWHSHRFTSNLHTNICHRKLSNPRKINDTGWFSIYIYLFSWIAR